MELGPVRERLLVNVAIAFIASLLVISIILMTGTRFVTLAPYFVIPGGVLILISLPCIMSMSSDNNLMDFIENQPEENARARYTEVLRLLRIKKRVYFITLGVGIGLCLLGGFLYFTTR